jgi:hypothetical protein
MVADSYGSSMAGGAPGGKAGALMEKKVDFESMINKSPNRRRFMRTLGIAGTVAGTVGALDLSGQSASMDAAILNFALNLEYLEAEFYTVATTGKTISQIGLTVTGTGSSGATTGGNQVTFTNATTQAVALELANDEQAHVALIQGALSSLGQQAIAKPAINLAALGIGFASQSQFLTLARVFEDIGVTAYAGAAPLIQSSVVLGYAARILAVEALHSGNIRLQVAQNNIATTALDGADHLPPPSGALYFTTDSMALVETRTPGQVLYLAFGGAANATSGGFFPNGVNGSLNTSSATPAATDGASLTASPNPIALTAGSTTGVTTISWNAPGAQFIQIRVGSPTGPLLTYDGNSGSMQTGNWVTNGMTFYLINVTNGQSTVLATLVVSAH